MAVFLPQVLRGMLRLRGMFRHRLRSPSLGAASGETLWRLEGLPFFSEQGRFSGILEMIQTTSMIHDGGMRGLLT